MLEFEHRIPNRIFGRLKQVVSIPPSDPDAVGAYPLSEAQVERFAQLLGLHLPSSFTYFLEPAYEGEDA
jgi:hypothetical protein